MYVCVGGGEWVGGCDILSLGSHLGNGGVYIFSWIAESWQCSVLKPEE